MKARLTEQYDVTFSKREMEQLMLALRTYVREFDASPEAEDMVAALEEVYTGPRLGVGITPTEIAPEGMGESPSTDPADFNEDDDEGGSPVPS